jgi:hypothetical protein
MMRSRRHLLAMALALAAWVASGCHKKLHQGGVDLSPDVAIQVTNNLNPPGNFSIYIVDENGGQRLLGEIGPNRTQTWHFRPTSSTARFRLVATAAPSGEERSQLFTLSNAAGIAWDMRTNFVAVQETP